MLKIFKVCIDHIVHQRVNPYQPSVALHIETNHLIFRANQMTCFCMKCNAGLKWVKTK